MRRGSPRGCAQQQQVHSAKSTDALHWLRTARRRLQRLAQHRSRVGPRCPMASCRLSGASSPPISWTDNCLAELKKPEWITELTRCTHTDMFKQQYHKVKKLGSGTQQGVPGREERHGADGKPVNLRGEAFHCQRARRLQSVSNRAIHTQSRPEPP